jgi:hypothetical protein
MQFKQLKDTTDWNPKAELCFALKKTDAYYLFWRLYKNGPSIDRLSLLSCTNNRFNFTYGVSNENNDSLPF